MEEKNRNNDPPPISKPIPADKVKLDEIVRSDAKTGRMMTGFWHHLCSALVIFMVFFYMYNAGWSPVAAQHHRGIYVLITYVLVFLNYPGRGRSPQNRPSAVDVILAAIAAAVVAYWIIEFEALNYRMGNETRLDYFVSTVGIIISLEVCRRVLGWSLTIVGATFIAYCYFGPYMPEIIAHRGFSFERIVTHVYLKQEGVFGIMADVLVTYVILFIFFGAFLKKSGVGKFFLDLPLALAGRSIGGPAKVAVLASGFFGSVSGSAIANTVSTGAFTIPLMKRTGFRPHVAGAIEPASSVGGMFMPPIMGAGGFLMAEMTGVQYVTIMKMAIFPAFLYFLAVFVMVHFEAKRYGLVGMVEEGAPNAWQILKKQWYMSLPLVIIVVMMLIGYSPGFAAVLATRWDRRTLLRNFNFPCYQASCAISGKTYPFFLLLAV
ncbi:MAG: TRAP transporter fused permease subunit [Desulfatiglandaceae bacterium]